MSKTNAPSKLRQAYKFIESHSGEFNVMTMCRVLGLSEIPCLRRVEHYTEKRLNRSS